MFAQRLFNHSAELMAGLISRLIFSRWARGYEEHHGSCEDAYVARLGPLHLEVNRCFVLDHDDAFISLRVPTPIRQAQSPRRASRGGWLWGKLHLGYVVCLGEDEIRRPGFYTYLQKPLPKLRPEQSTFSSDDEFPF
jgi:hypothetical protein